MSSIARRKTETEEEKTRDNRSKMLVRSSSFVVFVVILGYLFVTGLINQFNIYNIYTVVLYGIGNKSSRVSSKSLCKRRSTATWVWVWESTTNINSTNSSTAQLRRGDLNRVTIWHTTAQRVLQLWLISEIA